MKKAIFALMSVMAMGMVSCSSDDDDEIIVDENAAKLDIQFQTVTSEVPVMGIFQENAVKQAAAEGVLSFNEGQIILDELEFKGDGPGDAVEIKFEVEENTVIDFATGTSTPDIGALSLPAGSYEEVKLELDLEDDTDQPSILLLGTYVSPEGVESPVRFEFEDDQEFEVKWEGGAVLFEEAQTAMALITFDPTAWFSGVTNTQFAEAVRDEAGMIVVSSSVNPEIYQVVADGLELASEVKFGDNGDEDEVGGDESSGN